MDFDHVLRKEAFTDCVTPSNPTPVPSGFALDIYKLLEKVPFGLGTVMDAEVVALERRAPVQSYRSLPRVDLSPGDLDFITFQSSDEKPLLKTSPIVTKRLETRPMVNSQAQASAPTSQTEAQFSASWRNHISKARLQNTN